jgi:exodeoxyribonuclease V beta subunit
VRALDVDSLPLRGTHLIEASAGTGKTHTLATLYVRLIVERELDVARIALVTFTDAAARELSTRVRQMLRQHASPLARLALQRFDAARIGTIHRLFRRLLDEFAFDLGRTPTRAEPSDGALTRSEALRDYWRGCAVRMMVAEFSAFVAWCKDVETLDRRVQEVLRVPAEQRLPPWDAQADAQRAPKLAALRAEGVELRARDAWAATWAQLHGANELKRAQQTPFHPGMLADAQRAMAAWLDNADAAAPAAATLSVLCDATQRACLHAKRTASWVAPDAAIQDWAQRCMDLLDDTERSRRVRWLSDAAEAVTAALAKARRERELVTFDELILDLHRALHGPHGARVARHIRDVLDAALVDEFQDTDAEQYAVFRRLFVDEPDGTLIVVGDPKQAIYRFRGGDVFAYRAAVRDAGEQRWALVSNWRSDARLIDAVNAVFDAQRVPQVFHHDFIAFAPATYAGGDKQALRAAHAWPTPLRFWLADGQEATNKTQRTDVAVRACVDTIATLLRAATPPSSMAILTRTNDQVDAVMAGLRQRGIAAASRGKEHLAETDMALELLTLLDALAHDEDDGRQRAALATRMLGYDAAALRALDVDGAAWSRAMAELEQLREAHARGGLPRLLWRLVAHAAPRLLSRPEGNRHVSDLRQLAAWLVEAGTAAGGLAQAAAWLARMRASSDTRDAERATTDDHAVVQVLTMHKAKGLEWDVVFAPFLWDERDSSHDEPPVRFHDAHDRLLVDLGSRDIDQHQALHADEARAEAARVIYVALTRARVACFVLTFQSAKPSGSVFETVLRGGTRAAPGAADLSAALTALVARAPEAIALLPLPEAVDTPTQPTLAPEVQPRPWQRRIERGFALLSYSALMSEDAADARDHDTYVQREDNSDDNPRGARLGECVHGLLELALQRDTAGVEPGDIDAHGLRFGFRGRARDVVRALVTRTLDATLDAATPTRLRDLPSHARTTELEFHFAWHAGAWDAFVAAHGDEPAWVGRVRRAPQGLFHGYIDLVYAHGGRWYVLDYKTNDLGSADDAYAPAQLEQAIAREGYDVQALIYSLAVHRLLRQRLGAQYDYDQHYGGAWYWFVRGLHAGGEHGRYLTRPSRAVIDALDRAFARSAP